MDHTLTPTIYIGSGDLIGEFQTRTSFNAQMATWLGDKYGDTATIRALLDACGDNEICISFNTPEDSSCATFPGLNVQVVLTPADPADKMLLW